MNAFTSWRARKQAELDLLAELLDERPPIASDSASIVEAKSVLRARLVARAIAGAPSLGESRLDGQRTPAAGGALAYFYQRHDLRLARHDFHTLVHPALAGDFLALGWLAGSGMAALTSLYVAIDRGLAEQRALLLPADAYFETHQVARRELRHLLADWDLARAPLDGSVLHLDSIARRPPLAALAKRDLSGLALAVCDTTCWPRESSFVKEVVDRVVIDARVPLVLVRSHLKLDQLGTEHARLGSVVLLLPKRPTREQVAIARGVRRRALDFLALTGGGFSPHALWPAAFDSSSPRFDDFERLNRARNQILVDNHRRAVEKLSALLDGPMVKVLDYHHGCFFVLQPLIDTEHVCRRYARELVARLCAAGLDAREAPSFAYDFFAITRVGGFAGGAPTSALRLALPDCDQATLDTFVAVTSEWAADLSPV